jgi:hypothetical protein
MAKLLLTIALFFASLSLAEVNNGYLAADAGSQLTATNSIGDNSGTSDHSDDISLCYRAQNYPQQTTPTSTYGFLPDAPVDTSRQAVSIRAPPRSSLYFA